METGTRLGVAAQEVLFTSCQVDDQDNVHHFQVNHLLS